MALNSFEYAQVENEIDWLKEKIESLRERAKRQPSTRNCGQNDSKRCSIFWLILLNCDCPPPPARGLRCSGSLPGPQVAGDVSQGIPASLTLRG
jgi:hypothetical protein